MIHLSNQLASYDTMPIDENVNAVINSFIKIPRVERLFIGITFLDKINTRWIFHVHYTSHAVRLHYPIMQSLLSTAKYFGLQI